MELKFTKTAVDLYNDLQTSISISKKMCGNNKEAIAEWKQGKNEYLTDISERFHDLYNIIIYRLLRSDDILYGTFLMDMPVQYNFEQNGLFDTNIESEPFVLIVNPFHAEIETTANITTLLLAEVLRIIYLHPTFFKENADKDITKLHEKLEMSSDSDIYNLLKNDIKLANRQQNTRMSLQMTDTMTSPAKLEENSRKSPERNKDMMYYLKFIEAYYKFPDNPSSDEDSDGEGSGAGDGCISTPDSPSKNPNNNTHKWETSTHDPERFRSDVNGKLNDILSSMTEKERGLVPGNLMEQISKLSRTNDTMWQRKIRNMVGNIPYLHVADRNRVSRRYPFRYDIPGKKVGKTIDITVAIDTSASMSNDELSYCFAEVQSICKSRKCKVKIDVIEADAEINHTYSVERDKQVSFDVHGRGGTSFIPVIEEMNSRKKKNALLIYFTDGGGDWEIPKPKGYKIIWVLTPGMELSVKNPMGSVLSLGTDRKIKEMRMNV